MDEIYKNDNGHYCAKEIENTPANCSDNLMKRICKLTDISDWQTARKVWVSSYIIDHFEYDYHNVNKENHNHNHKHIDIISFGDDYNKNALCICGHKIKIGYIVYNPTIDKYAQIGSQCITKINDSLVDDYNKKLKDKVGWNTNAPIKGGKCNWCANIYYKNIEKHSINESHFHKRKMQLMLFKLNLEKLMKKHINTYKQTMRKKEEIKNKRFCIEKDCYKIIKNDEPYWKIRCLKCYIKNKKFNSGSKIY
jgi:hypothetical protein